MPLAVQSAGEEGTASNRVEKAWDASPRSSGLSAAGLSTLRQIDPLAHFRLARWLSERQDGPYAALAAGHLHKS